MVCKNRHKDIALIVIVSGLEEKRSLLMWKPSPLITDSKTFSWQSWKLKCISHNTMVVICNYFSPRTMYASARENKYSQEARSYPLSAELVLFTVGPLIMMCKRGTAKEISSPWWKQCSFSKGNLQDRKQRRADLRVSDHTSDPANTSQKSPQHTWTTHNYEKRGEAAAQIDAGMGSEGDCQHWKSRNPTTVGCRGHPLIECWVCQHLHF